MCQPGRGTDVSPAGPAGSQGQEKVRVLVVEDNPFVRGGIVRLVNGQADMACCGEASSIADTPMAVAAQKPNVVLLDLKLEDGEAFETALTGARRLES